LFIFVVWWAVAAFILRRSAIEENDVRWQGARGRGAEGHRVGVIQASKIVLNSAVADERHIPHLPEIVPPTGIRYLHAQLQQQLTA
jgi:hypothetical protein